MYAPTLAPVSAALLVLAVAGCAETEPWVASLATSELASPAGPSSGEPFVSVTEGAVYMSWLEDADGDEVALRMAELRRDAWSEPTTIASSSTFFVNWADFPSVRADAEGTLWAHWLQRDGRGSLDYSVQIVRSADGGRSWSDPWKLHEDTVVVDHGFVSAIPVQGGFGFAWLDGRNNVGGHGGPDAGHGGDPQRAMSLRYRVATSDEAPGPEELVDDRVCDCCQTDAVLTPSGPIIVYRDRSPVEIRDISISRFVGGAWTEGQAVHADGWESYGCPVNGPAAAMVGEALAVAWFTGAGGTPRVKVSFSHDDGVSFGPAIVVDDGEPEGRVDVVQLPDGRAGVTWLERTGGDGAAVRLRAVAPDGSVTASATLSESSSARASGFPRTVTTPWGTVLVAWTDATREPTRVRVTEIDPGGR